VDLLIPFFLTGTAEAIHKITWQERIITEKSRIDIREIYEDFSVPLSENAALG